MMTLFRGPNWLNHPRIVGSLNFSTSLVLGFWGRRGETWWDSFYDECGVGFVGVVWTFVDFEAL